MMADNITIQGFNNHLAYTMDSILQGLCDFFIHSFTWFRELTFKLYP